MRRSVYVDASFSVRTPQQSHFQARYMHTWLGNALFRLHYSFISRFFSSCVMAAVTMGGLDAPIRP